MPLEMSHGTSDQAAVSADGGEARSNESRRRRAWQYEPKWDGFRCLAFRDGDEVELQSKAGQPLGRYFPEVVEAVRALKAKKFVLDGEIVVPVDGELSFDDLLQRIHPAESRIKQARGVASRRFTSCSTCSSTSAARRWSSIRWTSAARRSKRSRRSISRRQRSHPPLAGDDRHRAGEAMVRLGGGGTLDGVIAKRLDCDYRSGRATAWRRSSACARPSASSAGSATARRRRRRSARCCSACTTTTACSITSASARRSPRSSART